MILEIIKDLIIANRKINYKFNLILRKRRKNLKKKRRLDRKKN